MNLNFLILSCDTKCINQTRSETRKLQQKVWNLTSEISAAAAAAVAAVVFGQSVSWRVTQSFQHIVNSFKCLKWKRPRYSLLEHLLTVSEKCVWHGQKRLMQRKHQPQKLFVFNSFYKVSRLHLRPRLLAEDGRVAAQFAEAS